MDTWREAEEQKQVSDPSLSSVSDDKLDEGGRHKPVNPLFGSSRIFLEPSEKAPERADLQSSLILQRRAAEHFTNGTEAMTQNQYEKAVVCFHRAKILQPQQVEVCVRQAEAFLQLCDFQSAAECYQQALLLQSGVSNHRLALIYYLRGQCLFDGGLLSEALEAFCRAAELQPDCRAFQVRGLACLAAAGRHGDCLRLLDGWMSSGGPAPNLYLLRARLHRRMNQDVKSALNLDPSYLGAKALLVELQEASEEARRRAVELSLSGRLPGAICMINSALENLPQDPRLYLFRATLYRRVKDFTLAIEDLIQAVELSEEEKEEEEEEGCVARQAQFQLVLTYNDFAVQCFSRGLYTEAMLLLNRAIQQEKNQAGLYLNRGDCFFQQGDWYYSLADYQQAEEMMGSDHAAVRLRLAVVHNKLGSIFFHDGCFQRAVDMFSLALRSEPSASQYYESRSKAFRKLQQLDRARRDLTCLLLLDPGNPEVPALLMSLFPGHGVCDVLSSAEGKAVRAQLLDSLQTFPSEPRRVSEALQKTTLTEEPSSADRELKLCGNPRDLQVIVKSLSQPLKNK